MLLARHSHSVQPIASTSSVPYSITADDATSTSDSQQNQQHIIVNGQLKAVEKSGGRLKKYVCSYPDCGKAYTRPVRLEEHIRSHTGERPYKCDHCDSTFLRESHLKAHARTHLNDQDKTLACDSCDKRFWTSQHLRKHIEVVHHGKTYDCSDCGASFRKHNLLRTHIAEEHSPPGTNPFRCDHPGCGKSFKQNVHLKSHSKMHDPSRYMCAHPDCLSLPLESRQFPNWSALGKHTKTAHPPRCPHPECKGRTFASSRGLKGHLQLHDEGADVAVLTGKKRRVGARQKKGDEEHHTLTELDGEHARASPDSSGEGDDQDSDWEERQDDERDERMQADFARGGKKKRRIMARIDTDSPWPCENCSRRFKSHNALKLHIASAHSSTSVAGNRRSPGARSARPPEDTESIDNTDSLGTDGATARAADPSLLDLLTGASYRPETSSNMDDNRQTRKYRCPYPSILDIAFPLPARPSDAPLPTPVDASIAIRDGPCSFYFARAYDVERHLKSHHHVAVARDELDKWLARGSLT